jgi:hypothetical protein
MTWEKTRKQLRRKKGKESKRKNEKIDSTKLFYFQKVENWEEKLEIR